MKKEALDTQAVIDDGQIIFVNWTLYFISAYYLWVTSCTTCNLLSELKPRLDDDYKNLEKLGRILRNISDAIYGIRGGLYLLKGKSSELIC